MAYLEKYSFSKLKNFESCKYGFYRRYFEEDWDGATHGTSEFGTFCHNILEKYFNGELKQDELLDYYIKNYDENVTASFDLYMSAKFKKNFAEAYYKDGYEYFKNFTWDEELVPIAVEHSFNVNVDNKFILIGKIDLICQKDDKFIIIDHKSKSKFKNKTEKHDYARQLYIYAAGFYKKYKRFPDELRFNMFRKGDYVNIEFNIDDYNEAIDWCRKVVEDIDSTFDFSPNGDEFYCRNFCGFRNDCKYGILPKIIVGEGLNEEEIQ